MPWIIALAVGFTLPAASPGFEPLSEAELDRTVASGLQAPLSSNDAQAEQGSVDETAAVSEKDQSLQETDDESTRAEEGTSDSAREVTLIAYREALPVVMSRMTSASRGPLGPNGSYSLSPFPDVRGLKPATSTQGLRLAPLFPLPNGFVLSVP